MQHTTPIHTSFSQLLPSLNGFYNAQLDAQFDEPSPSSTKTKTKTTSSSNTISNPMPCSPHQANYTWAQLLSSRSDVEDEEDDYDTRFAAEEAELVRAGIIRPSVQSETNSPAEHLEGLCAQIHGAETPAAALAGQIAWYAALDGGSGYATGNGGRQGRKEADGQEDGEEMWAEGVRGARTPRGCLEKQIRWCAAREISEQ
ncbi:hypothetical protein K504DRAFT_466482 [Pleomassaria siparia CBS 279.74]|uniref:Uncharacterized protein n=1 Tax=Pleomassaria siparia CBS 279.74 TaxID=1314801 RepID=A0A6G1KCG5_9PLEO|nr:hypothetical protein K504DRAFT_466482 [Pleomassaria siparia CBS 279.74]